MQRVFVTGIGTTNSLATSREQYWQRLIAGESGIRSISRWDVTDWAIGVAAEAQEIPASTGAEWFPADHARPAFRLFAAAATEAYQDALLHEVRPEMTVAGAAAGTSANYNDLHFLPACFKARENRQSTFDLKRLDPLPTGRRKLLRSHGETILSVPARVLRLDGPNLVIDTACAASAHAIGEAFRLIQYGEADFMICGGSGAYVSPFPVLAFELIGALSRNRDPSTASRPFDRKRDGFVIGEAAGALVLESEASMARRGAAAYAELRGYGQSLNAHSLTDPTPDGSGEARALERALAEARLPRERIGFIAAHGTSTPKNDPTETQAIKRVFGQHAYRLAVSSNKGQIGHTIAAAGAMNAISACLAIRDQIVPPTAGLADPDLACDLDYVPGAGRQAPVHAAAVNAFAFGGQNASLIFAQPSGGRIRAQQCSQ